MQDYYTTMQDEHGRSKKGHRKRRKDRTTEFQPKANVHLNPEAFNGPARGRVVQPTLPPPRHLPKHIMPPKSSKYNPEVNREEPTQVSPAVAMNTWQIEAKEQSARTFGSTPKPPRLPPLPAKPAKLRQEQQALIRGRDNAPTMAPPRHLPTNVVPPPDSMAIPRPVQKKKLQEFGSQAQAFASGTDLRKDSMNQKQNFGSQITQSTVSKSGRKRRRRKKKRLNKFKSTEDHDSDVQYVPPTFKQVPLVPPKPASTPIPALPQRRGRTRESSKNPSGAFFGLASKEANDIRFDDAMQKMKLKMDKKNSRNDIFAEVTSQPRTREKSRQVQQKLQSQFGFFQSKFSHKDKQTRRGQNRKGQPVPTLPPRRRNNPASNYASLF